MSNPTNPSPGALDPKEYLLSAISCIHAGRHSKAEAFIEKALQALAAPGAVPDPKGVQGLEEALDLVEAAGGTIQDAVCPAHDKEQIIGYLNQAHDILDSLLAQAGAAPNGGDELAYAIQIATYGVRKFTNVPTWKPLDTLMGVLSQIDNLLAGTPATRAPNGVRGADGESPGPMSSGQRPDVPSIAIRAPDSNQGAGSPAGLDLGAIERRAKAACPGPWVKTSHQDGRVTYWTVNRGMEDENGNVTLLPGRQLFRVMRSGDEGANDAGFLAHAREDIFALLEIARAALAAPVALGAAPNGVREAAALRVCSLLDGFQKEYEYNTLGRKMPGNDLYGDKLMAIVEEVRAALSSPLSVGAALPPELIGDGPCDDCGTANNIRWFIESETWNKVVREGNPMDAMLCINCFVKRAALRGIDPPAWELVVEDEFNPGPRRNAPDERSESEPSNSHVTGSEVEGKKGDEAQGPVIDMDGGLIDQSEDYPCPFCTQPLESHNGYYTCPNKACSFPLGYSKATAGAQGSPTPGAAPEAISDKVWRMLKTAALRGWKRGRMNSDPDHELVAKQVMDDFAKSIPEPIESESPSAGEPSTPNQEDGE
jgi:hypothetical protein